MSVLGRPLVEHGFGRVADASYHVVVQADLLTYLTQGQRRLGVVKESQDVSYFGARVRQHLAPLVDRGSHRVPSLKSLGGEGQGVILERSGLVGSLVWCEPPEGG